MGTVSWLLRCTSSLSILGSSLIIYMIKSGQRTKLQLSHNRILLAMSILDILQSTAIAFLTTPAPRDSGLPDALGNDTTCAIQGFFIQMGFAVPLYSAALSIYYLLRIRYDVNCRQLSRRFEPFCHSLSLLFPLGSGIMGVCLGLFQAVSPVCWIDPFDEENCHLLFVITVSILSFSFVTSVYSIVSTFYAIREKEANINIYESAYATTIGRRHDLALRLNYEMWEIMKQLFLYFAGFFVTYFWIFVASIYNWSGRSPPPVLLIFVVIFTPLQGLWNLFTYAQPVFCRIRRAMPEKSIGWTMWHTVFNVPEIVDSQASSGSSRQPSQTNDIVLDQWSVEKFDDGALDRSDSCQSELSTKSDFTDCANNMSTIHRLRLESCNDISL